MDKNLLSFFFLIIAFTISNTSNSQNPIADFSISNNPACKNEVLNLINKSENGVDYQWDFCSEDLVSDSPIINELVKINGSNIPLDIKIINSLGKWYGFVTSRLTNNIFRVDFGSDLSNINPSVINLGNPGSTLSAPDKLDIYYDSGRWYIFITNDILPFGLVRLDFGPNIEETNPSAINFGDFSVLNRPRGINISNDNGQFVISISNSTTNKIVLIDFGNSLSNTPLTSIQSDIIPDSDDLRSMEIIKLDGIWYGYSMSKLNKSLHKIEFGPVLYKIPTIFTNYIVQDLTDAISMHVAKSGIEYYAFFAGLSTLEKFYLGNPSENTVPVRQIMDSNSIVSAVDVVHEQGKDYVFGINHSTKLIHRWAFENDCGANITYSEDFEPTGVNFSNSGSYNIELVNVGSNGTRSNTANSVSVNENTDLIIDTENFCIDNTNTFSALSTETLTSYLWNFGDGTPNSTLSSPVHQYLSAGTYSVSLTVESEFGCGNTISRDITIYNPPKASYDIPFDQVCANNSITFTNTSTFDAGSPTTWLWDFGDGSPTSTDQGTSHIFTSGGTYTVSLSAEMPTCTDVFSTDITIVEAPTTLFSFNNTCNSQVTTFTDETTGSNLTKWNWNFGDDNTSIEQSPIHRYTDPGEYDVTLTVTNNTGCFTTSQQTIINHSIPLVSFTNDLPCSTTPIRFFDESLVENTNIVAWEWDFGDGTTSNIQHPEHSFNTTGDFTVKLKAYSQFGCVDSTQKEISVAQGPEVDFSRDKSCEGEETTFTDLTNSFGNSISNWVWIVDGQLLSDQNPSYAFNSAGTYTVQLSVTMSNSCAQTLSQDIIVEIPPVVQFDFEENCIGSGTSFYDLTDQTDDGIIAREWRVDGSVIGSDSLSVVELSPGNYDVTLSVITVAGCEETKTSSITLIGSPVANFSANTIYGAAPLNVSFTNNSTGGSSYLWSFNDGQNSTSTEKSPQFTFEEIGTYNVTLRTSSNPECYAETTEIIEVVEPVTKASIIAITPVENNGVINFILTIENNGSTLLDSNMNLLFRADYGTEIIDSFKERIFASKTINYQASFALPANSAANNVCVELIVEDLSLDRDCITLNQLITISEPYPNPSTGLFNIDVMLQNNSSIKIRVLNRSGQPVITKSYEGIIGLNELLIDGQGLPQDIYLVEITSEGKTEIYKSSIVR